MDEDKRRKMIRKASEGRSIASPNDGGQAGRMKLASYHAKLILGSYRADQANDPDVYITAITHLLARYPTDIGARLTDPKDGVAGKYKFLPTVSEVKEEAERLEASDWRAEAERRSIRDQFNLRAEMDAADKAEPLEHRVKVAARIKNELRGHGFQFREDTKKAWQPWKQFSADELLARYGKRP